MAQHLINLCFDLDDSDIIERVKKEAVKKVEEKVRKDALESIGLEGTGWCNESRWHNYMTNITNSFLEEHKEEIINGAIDKLADKLARTKVVREKVSELLDDQ